MRYRYLLILSAFVFGCSSASQSNKTVELSYFYAFGDMPYRAEDVPRYNRLVKNINDTNPDFSIHVGDTKSGSTLCSDDFYKRTLEHFNDFKKPLIYTPGDNEWTDCDREACGAYEAEERLEYLRKTMFINPTQSFGKNPIDLVNQSTVSTYDQYVENVMWNHKEVVIATVHICGSSNNYQEDIDNSEFIERESAAIDWIQRIFQKANDDNARGIVMAFHANMFGSQSDPGYQRILAELKQQISNFEKPVLGIYGDSHRFLISQPLYMEGNLLTNFTALMVFGSSDVNYVKIKIDIDRDNLFDIEPVYIN